MLRLKGTGDREQLVATVRDFCAREFAPHIQANDREGRHDPEIFAKLASIGLPGVCFPQRYGGYGLDYLSLGLVCEELEYVDTVYRTVLSVPVGLGGMAPTDRRSGSRTPAPPTACSCSPRPTPKPAIAAYRRSCSIAPRAASHSE